MRARRWLRDLVVGVPIALVVFFAFGETITRMFDVVDRLSPLPRGLFMATADPDLPYVLRPGAEVTQLGVEVHVNALGLRGPEVAATPAPGVRRVLALGDSVRRPGRWEVLNAGVQGYDSTAEAAWLATRGSALSPEIVVVGFNLNDYDPAPVLGERGILTNARGARRAPWSPADVSEFYFLLRWLVATRGQTIFGPQTPTAPRTGAGPWHPFDRKVSEARKRYYHEPPDARWRRMVAALRRMRETTARDGAALIVALIPDGDQIDVPKPDLEPQRRLRGTCDDLGIECLDLAPNFASASHGEGSLFLDIMHPNAAGNAVIAARLAERLLAR
jgi:hypothetical protein